MEDLNINNPNFKKNYNQWQKNLADKRAEQDFDDTDYREIGQDADDYVLDSWGF